MPTLFKDAVERIRAGARELDPLFGWEFLYCPSSLLSERSRLWFIGINPGRNPAEKAKKEVQSSEGGNAYYVDQDWSHDGERLRTQVKEFFDELAGALVSGCLNGQELSSGFRYFSKGK